MARKRLTQEEAQTLLKEGYKKFISVQLMNDSHLQSDFSERYGDDYVSRWQTQSDLKKYYDDLAKLRDHTNLYRAYLNDYGTDEQKASLGDIDSALASYDAVLAEKDTVMSYYAPYASAEEFNTAYAENQAKIARNNKLAAMDIDAAKAKLDKLENNIAYHLNYPDAWKKEKDALKRDIEDAETIQNLQQLESVTENDDFSDFSTGKASVSYFPYQYINATSQADKGIIRYSSRQTSEEIDSLYDYFTDKEKGIFNYYVETNQIKKAKAYKAALEETLLAREAEDMFAFGEDHPFLASLASIPLNLLSSVEQIGRIFDGKTNQMANVSSALRAGVSSEMGGLGSFLYNTGMSAADSVLAALAPGQIGTVMLGLSAAGQTQNDIIQRGGTKEEAMLGGLAAGIFEGFFEHFSIGELQKMKPNEIVRNFKVFIGNVGKEIGVNASEEAATELANILTDEIVMGELSNFSIAFEKYKEQGMSDTEAGMKIAGDLIGQVLEAGASGALMGFGFATLGGGIGAVQRTVDGKRIVQADSEGRTKKLLIGKAETLFGDKAEYAEQRKLLDEVKQHLGKDTPAQQHRFGVLAQEVQKANAKELMNKAQENVSRTVKQAQESASAAIIGGKNADVVYEHLPEIVEYTGMNGKQIMVKGKDGETVSLSSLSLQDEELGELYAYATTLGSVEAANSFLTYYEADMAGEGTTPTDFWTSWMGIQTMGQTLGASDSILKEARATYGGTLSGDAVTAAIIAGVNLRNRAQKQKTEAAEAYKKAWKEAGGEVKQGKFDDSKIQDKLKNEATEEQRAIVDFARVFSDVFGVNVTFFASKLKNGKRSAENGRYDSKTNTIYLDLYAGVRGENIDVTVACLINTLSHEVVHNMAVNAPTEYFALRDYIMEYLSGKDGYNLEEKIQKKIDDYAEHGKKLTREEAIEEIVAAACEDMLGSSETVREFMEGFYEKNKKAAEKFSDTIKKILENLKEFFQKILDILGKKSNSVEAKAVRAASAEIIAEIQKRFDAGMLALREGNVARNAVGKQKSTMDDGVKYSLNRNAENELHKALYDKNYKGEVLLRDHSPAIMIEQQGVRDFPMAMNASHIRENVFTETEAKELGLRVDRHKHYHGLGEKFFLQIIDSLDDVKEAYRGTKNAEKSERRENYFLLVSQFVDKNGDTINVPIYIDEFAMINRVYIDVNKISTVFGKENFRSYINQQIAKKNLVRIKRKSTQSSESNALLARDYGEDAFNNSISQTDEKSSEISKKNLEESETELLQLRMETPEPSEILSDLFADKAAYAGYKDHEQSFVKYRNLQTFKAAQEKKIAEIDQKIAQLRSEKRQSGKGSRMDDLYQQRKRAEDKLAEYKKRIFAMEAKELRAIVDAETRKAVERMQKETSEKYRAKSQERTENRSRREYIEKIEKRAKALGKAIEENSKDSHIPEIFQRTVADLISALDFSSRRSLAGGEATKKEALLVDAMQRMSEALNNRLRDENGKETASEALQAYLLACDMKDDLAKEFGDIYYNINQIARQYGSGDAIVLEKMSSDDLKALNSALFNISKMISTANKMIANHRYASIEALAETSIADLKEFERYHSKIEGAEKFLRWSHATPFTAFRRMGNGSYSLFEEFMDGMDDFAFKAESILDFTDEAYTKKESRDWSEQIHCFETNGGMLYMTTADIMSLYCLNKRQKSNDFTGGDHIGGGGIQLGKRKGTIEGEKGTKEYANDPSGVAVSQALLSEILSKLTDRQREVADALQRFMSETCAEWGNEISMKRFGTRQFLEQFYFPIQSSKETLYQDGTERTKDQALFALLNASFTQKLNEQANNRIEIRNIFDVFADHAVMMAKYHAFAFALLDMRKWLNYKVKTNIELGEEGKGFETAEIRALLKNAYGEAAEKYIKTFLEDINGAHTETDRDMTLLKKMVSNYKIAAVGANLNVALIQPTAYLRASAEIDPRYMVKELKDTPQIGQAIKRAMQYSGMMVWKSLGYRDVNIAASLQDKIKHTESTMHKIQEKTMILAEKADQITWGALWLACEEETKAKRNDLTDQTDEFYRAVALRFREVIYATQVVDSPLTKSQFMRSKSGWNSFFGSFMSEPVQSYNTFLRVADEITDRKRRGQKITTNQFRKLGRVTAAFFMCELATALIRSFLDAFHDYDEDEEYWELYRQNFIETFVSGLVVPKIPVIKDFFEAAKQALLGEYASSRMDMALFERGGRFGRNLYNLMFTDKDVSWSKIVKSFLDFLSTAMGLPFSNLYREVESTYKAFVK